MIVISELSLALADCDFREEPASVEIHPEEGHADRDVQHASPVQVQHRVLQLLLRRLRRTFQLHGPVPRALGLRHEGDQHLAQSAGCDVESRTGFR